MRTPSMTLCRDHQAPMVVRYIALRHEPIEPTEQGGISVCYPSREYLFRTARIPSSNGGFEFGAFANRSPALDLEDW